MAYTNNLTKEEQQKNIQEKVSKSFDKVNRLAVSVFTNDSLPAFLRYMARHHYFDCNNLLLLYGQHPTATFFASYEAWARISRNLWNDPKRRVLLVGQTTKKVLAPYVLKKTISDTADHRTGARRARDVFYLEYTMKGLLAKEQTNNIPAPTTNWNAHKNKMEAEAAFNSFKAVAPFNIVFSTDNNFKGNYVFNEGTATNGRADTLILNPYYRNNYYALCNFTIKTLVESSLKAKGIHEKISHVEFEKILECVSYVVSSYFGLSLDGHYFFFVNTWHHDSSEIIVTLDRVRRASHTLIEKIEAEMIEYMALYGHDEDIYDAAEGIAGGEDAATQEDLLLFDLSD